MGLRRWDEQVALPLPFLPLAWTVCDDTSNGISSIITLRSPFSCPPLALTCLGGWIAWPWTELVNVLPTFRCSSVLCISLLGHTITPKSNAKSHQRITLCVICAYLQCLRHASLSKDFFSPQQCLRYSRSTRHLTSLPAHPPVTTQKHNLLSIVFNKVSQVT